MRAPPTHAMRVRALDDEVTGALRAFLVRLGCGVEAGEGATLVVSIPRSQLVDAARLELDVYLRLWEATHPDSPVEFVA